MDHNSFESLRDSVHIREFESVRQKVQMAYHSGVLSEKTLNRVGWIVVKPQGTATIIGR